MDVCGHGFWIYHKAHVLLTGYFSEENSNLAVTVSSYMFKHFDLLVVVLLVLPVLEPAE